MDYFIPDEAWEIFGIKSREEYLEKYVVESKFHIAVPRDISESFRTVSYLLAHSYYYWPMYDEALSKALLIMEMAVKLRAIELEIDLKKSPNKKGVSYDKTLSDLIKEVCSGPYKVLIDDFERARSFRNFKMHPTRHAFMGALNNANKNSYLFINIINQLFLPPDQIARVIQQEAILRKKLFPFKSGLFVLNFNNKKILINGFHIHKYREFDERLLLMLYINPITTKVEEQYVQKRYPSPLILCFSEFEISEDRISGKDLEGGSIEIYIDDKEANLKTYFEYNQALSEITETDLNMFLHADSQRALWQMEKIIYEYCWNDVVYQNIQ